MARAKKVIAKRKFVRDSLSKKLSPTVYKSIVNETKELLERRFKSLAVELDHIEKTNFNPLLLLITAPVYNIYSPFEVAERLQLGKAFHGDDTAFGRFGEEKLLPLFGAERCMEKTTKKATWEPIDAQVNVDGKRYLMTIKSGPWTMNQSHANAMIEKFPKIHEETGCPILIGVMYGRYANLNNKPKLVADELGNPDWFDYLVGKDFWEFVSGIEGVHKKIFDAIREAQRLFAAEHRDETFQERLVANRVKIAASLRKEFNVDEEEDFWRTLFNKMF